MKKEGAKKGSKGAGDRAEKQTGTGHKIRRLNIDMTEHKTAEQALHESEERFRQMAENIREAFWISEPGMARILYVSPAYEEIWGQSPESVIEHPQSLFEIILPEDRDLLAESLERQQKGEKTDIEFRIARPDGSIRWVRNRAFPIRNEAGEVYRVTGFCEDITERRRSTEILKIIEAAVQSTSEAIGIADPQLRHIYQNEALYDMFGYTVDELNAAGGPVAVFVDKEAGRQVMETILNGGSVAHEMEVVDKQGRKFLVFQRADSIRDADGRIVGLIGIHRDITERKQAEADLQEYAERLRAMAAWLDEADESERHQLSRELHDGVGQNLTALGISLNVLRNKLPTELQAELAPLCNDSLELVQETVQRIRDVMAELRPPLLDDYGLVAALGWYVRRFSQRTGIAALVEGEGPKPRLPLKVELSLFRIAQEALSNVAKHGQATRSTLTIDVRDGAIRLTVADDGVGFDPTAIHTGMERPGWGFLTMRERAEAARGQLLVESKPGKGTRVIVEVPAT